MGSPSSRASRAPVRWASSTQALIGVSANGTNGTTSMAPIRGCSPSWVVRSIRSIATRPAATMASSATWVSATKVTTDRLCAGSTWTSMTRPPGPRIAPTMASMTSGRRPSEKLGTDSTNGGMLPLPAVAASRQEPPRLFLLTTSHRRRVDRSACPPTPSASGRAVLSVAPLPLTGFFLWLVEEAVLGSPDGGLGAGGQVQLAQDVGDVMLDRLVRQEEVGRNLLVGLPMGGQPEDPLLLLGQGGLLHVVRGGRHLADPLQDLTGHFRIQQRPAFVDRYHGIDEGLLIDLLEQVARGPGHDGFVDRVFVGEGREHDHPGPQVAAQDLAAGVDPATAGHPDIQQDDVRPQQRRLIHGMLGGGGLADYPDPGVRFQQGSQAQADHLVVVRDQQLDLGQLAHR